MHTREISVARCSRVCSARRDRQIAREEELDARIYLYVCDESEFCAVCVFGYIGAFCLLQRGVIYMYMHAHVYRFSFACAIRSGKQSAARVFSVCLSRGECETLVIVTRGLR